MKVEVHRAGDRFVTRAPGVVSRHCFSFGQHYDPTNTSFGHLVAVNDEQLKAGAGFAPHLHRDLEIVSWVVAGELLHDDDAGHRGAVPAGVVQRLSAGRGVTHSERCEVPTRFVQSWLLPDAAGADAAYVTAVVQASALTDRLAVVAGDGGGLALGVRGAALLVGRLRDAVTVELPDAARRHLLVAVGHAVLGVDEPLAAGDSVRVTGPGVVSLTSVEPCEVLLWVMHDTPPSGGSEVDEVT